MKKFILTLVIALMMIFTANAQIATENSKFFDNTYVGVGVGATTPLNFNSVFPINPVAAVKVGKEITPILGVELEGHAFFNDNDFTSWTSTTVKGTNLGLNGTVNLNNIFDGYQGKPRVFETKLNAGLGWLHRWDNNHDNEISAKTGVDFNFNLGKKRAHSIVISPVIYWAIGGFNNLKFDKNKAQIGLIASYVYHFKTSNGTHYFKTYDVGAMFDEINRLNDELAKKPTEVVKIVEKEVPVTTATQVVNVTDSYVFFAFDSSELDDRAKAELDKLGENGIYRVDAWASNEGTTEYNQALSQRRADTVKEYLEGRGCKIDVAEGHGVQFGLTTGRVAIVTPFNR